MNKYVPGLWSVIFLVANVIFAQSTANTVDVTFESQGDTLAGTIWMPAGEGLFPAMVVVHGSGRATRIAERNAARHFSSMGVAVLSYDKRGVGASGGTYVGRNNTSRENLELLSDDVVAAVKKMRSTTKIDPDKIGLWGVSQAGWIIPLAVSKISTID